jgi:hypothetical protein
LKRGSNGIHLNGQLSPELSAGKINLCLFVRTRTMFDAPLGRHTRGLPLVLPGNGQQLGKSALLQSGVQSVNTVHFWRFFCMGKRTQAGKKGKAGDKLVHGNSV